MSRKFVRYYFCYDPAGMTCNPFIIEVEKEDVWNGITIRNNPYNKHYHFLSVENNGFYENARVFKSIFISSRGDKSFDIVTYMAIYADKKTHNALISQFNNIHNQLRLIE